MPVAGVTSSLTSLIGDHGVYAVFLLMAIDAVFPAASELVMVYAGALAAGAFAGEHVVLFGTTVSSHFWGFVVMALAGTLGYLVGSCSDRPLSYQGALWERLEIAADFTVLKHRLADLRARFAAVTYYHVGDTDVDERFAREAGFHFLRADAVAHRRWALELFPEAGESPR